MQNTSDLIISVMQQTDSHAMLSRISKNHKILQGELMRYATY